MGSHPSYRVAGLWLLAQPTRSAERLTPLPLSGRAHRFDRLYRLRRR